VDVILISRELVEEVQGAAIEEDTMIVDEVGMEEAEEETEEGEGTGREVLYLVGDHLTMGGDHRVIRDRGRGRGRDPCHLGRRGHTRGVCRGVGASVWSVEVGVGIGVRSRGGGVGVSLRGVGVGVGVGVR